MAIQYKNMNESIFNETFDRSIEHEQNSGMNTTVRNSNSLIRLYKKQEIM